ncbi:MAG: alpha/beta hydrolase [Halobacteriaceae archaeon]
MPDLHPDVQSHLDEFLHLPSLVEAGPEGAREQIHETHARDPDRDPVAAVTETAVEGPAGDVPVRVYRPTEDGEHPTLLWIHGGGWVIGDLDSHDQVARALCRTAEVTVASVGYRRAPEHGFPAAVQDCVAALEWAAAGNVPGGRGDALAVAGDSAGGNLSAVTALYDRDHGAHLARQVLLYPVTDDDVDRESYHEFADGYGLTREEMVWFLEHYFPTDLHRANPYGLPMKACDLAGLPPATVVTAEFDVLRDEGVAYAERLADEGVPVAHHHYERMNHGFVSHLADPDLDAARDVVATVADELEGAFT